MVISQLDGPECKFVLIHRPVNRESGRFGASDRINMPHLWTYEENGVVAAMFGCYGVPKNPPTSV